MGDKIWYPSVIPVAWFKKGDDAKVVMPFAADLVERIAREELP
jgi:hypothetical protein